MSHFRFLFLLFRSQLATRCEHAVYTPQTILAEAALGPRYPVDRLVRDPKLGSNVCCLARERECGETCMMDGVASFSCLAIPSDPMAGDLCSAHCTCNGPATE